jgi:hypothetical protein
MKTLRHFLLAAAACFGVARALAEPISDAELEKIPRADIVRTIRHQQALAAEGQERALVAEKHLAETQRQLSDATREGDAMKAHLAQVETSAQAVEKDRDAQEAQKIAALAEAAKEKVRADREAKESARRGNILGWEGAAILALGGAMLASVLSKILPAPWNMVAWGLPLLGAPAGYFLTRWII